MNRFFYLVIALSALFSSGCCRRPNEVWNDTKSCGRHINRGIRTLCGRNSISRQVHSKDQFLSWQENGVYLEEYQEPEFIPFSDDELGNQVAMENYNIPQPRQTPGDPGCQIPGIQAFRDPSTLPYAQEAFRNVYFGYDSNLIKGDLNLSAVQSAAAYMRSHPNLYLFIEGHCDERGPQAYNLALGSRRSNAVRNALIDSGVNPEHIFTISYGAEKPLVMESHEQAWSQNRRAEFKIYLNDR